MIDKAGKGKKIRLKKLVKANFCLAARDKRIAVDCRLPRTVDFEIQSMTSSAACRGRLALKPQSNDTMILTFDASCHVRTQTIIKMICLFEIEAVKGSHVVFS